MPRTFQRKLHIHYPCMNMAQLGTDIDFAKEILENDQVVGIPTETVYGLAGNALSEKAILKIYEVKNRPKFDPLIAHTDSIEKVSDLVQTLPSAAKLLADTFWPGPLTLLLHKKNKVPDLLTSGHERVAIRIPNHPLTRKLLAQIDFPLAAPSANPFGYVSPISALHVEQQLGHKIKYILDGGTCKIGVESTIVGFEKEVPVIQRLGGVPVEAIEEIVGPVEVKINASSNPSAPGMLKSHYSPGRKLIIGDIDQLLADRKKSSTGVISFCKDYNLSAKNQFILSEKQNLEEAASRIFQALRFMDAPHISEVLAEYVPDKGLGRAINDRLRRAAV